MLTSCGIECIAEAIIVRGFRVEIEDDDFGMVPSDQFQAFARSAGFGGCDAAAFQERMQHFTTLGGFVHNHDTRRREVSGRILPGG